MIEPYYQDEQATIYCCNCLDVLPLLEPVDHIITDPPFSEETHSRARSNRGNLDRSPKKAIDFDSVDDEFIKNLFLNLNGKVRRWIIALMDWRHIAELERNPLTGFDLVRFGVWVKTNPMPQLTGDRPANGWDGIAYFHNKANKKEWNGGGTHGNWIGPVVTDGQHPTGKPIKLIQHFVKNFTLPGETILDCFLGSGTTALAAKNLGRKCIGIEIEERYCEIAVKRLRQQTLFGV